MLIFYLLVQFYIDSYAIMARYRYLLQFAIFFFPPQISDNHLMNNNNNNVNGGGARCNLNTTIYNVLYSITRYFTNGASNNTIIILITYNL